MMIDHLFRGEGEICSCGGPRRRHRAPRQRAYHVAKGDPCLVCFQPAASHISPEIVKARQLRDQQRPPRENRPRTYHKRQRSIIGIDGEGKDLPDGSHVYTLLCAVNEHGEVVGQVENQNGLSTAECLEMLIALPRNTLKCIFMGSYDWTKIIEDLNLVDIFYIMHPEARRGSICGDCKKSWPTRKKACPDCESTETRTVQRLRSVSKDRQRRKCHYGFDWFNGAFTVAKPRTVHNERSKKRERWAASTKVWDVFKFFQCSFVSAIEAWGIGTVEQRERILKMKSKRGEFADEDPDDIRRYCQEECHLLALMMRKLIDSCQLAGIQLQRYDGAGAIANALLKKNSVRDFLGPPLETFDPGLQRAVMSAYFGGRFENSVVGFVEKPVFNRDIHSAYPYALTFLPCLSCGEWSHRTKDVLKHARAATLAVVHFRVKACTAKQRKALAWAPLPFRDADGSICYPVNFDGWAWLPELEAALRGWLKLVEVLEAYTYTTTCDHSPWEWMPDAYRQRCEWGKDGPGIVMKLGTNACAGKTMQNMGDPPPYKSWIWGGMVTATTRGQALDAVVASKDRWNILAIATDGVFTTERLNLPKARDTGTSDLKKPLGDWGQDEYPNGVFFVKPGMYFNDSRSLMRARGIGRSELDKRARELADVFQTWDRKESLKIRVQSRRFYGARSSVLMYSQCRKCNTGWPGTPSNGCPECRQMGDQSRTQVMRLKDSETPAYGRWDVRPIDIEFACLPKRESIDLGGRHGRMHIRDLDGRVSLPYEPGRTTPEGLAARTATEQALEEPDWNDLDAEV